MAALSDITITKLSGGLGRRTPGLDMISGLLANGVAAVGGVQLNEVYLLRSIDDAKDLLIDEAYDTTNSVLVFEHIKEFFRVNPSADLHLMLVAKSVTFAAMVDPEEETNAVKLLQDAQGNIRQLGVAYNPSEAVTDDTALVAAMAKAQLLANWAYSQHMPCEMILEGKGYDIDDPTDFRAQEAENVSVMVGQNKSVASGIGGNTYAALGTLLGAVSRAAVNENVGWVQEFDVRLKNVLESISISGTEVQFIGTNVLNNINTSGAIFFRFHAGRTGVYFNDAHTGTEATSDFAYLENNRTIHKAVRLIRQALLPRINSPVLVDQETGQLSPEVVKSIETRGRKALETMLSNLEVSGIDILVDPAQNILATSELKVEFSIIPTGTARQIKVTIGFDNPF